MGPYKDSHASPISKLDLKGEKKKKELLSRVLNWIKTKMCPLEATERNAEPSVDLRVSHHHTNNYTLYWFCTSMTVHVSVCALSHQFPWDQTSYPMIPQLWEESEECWLLHIPTHTSLSVCACCVPIFVMTNFVWVLGIEDIIISYEHDGISDVLTVAARQHAFSFLYSKLIHDMWD